VIKENLERVKARIAAAARSVGRNPEEVRLVCVTKGVPVERIREAIACGVTEIGENRVQEAKEKQPSLGREIRRHMIGHFQRNKAKLAAELFDVIHSVDSLELIEALDRRVVLRRADHPELLSKDDRLAQDERKLEVMVQVNVSGEATKSGCRPEEAQGLAESILKAKNLRWVGLMTMAPFHEDPEAARPVFRRLRELGEDLQKKFSSPPLHLSMGMSHDFEVAVQEGATMVRIGTAIFGGS